MNHMTANIHMERGDRFHAYELDNCNGAIAVGIGVTVGVSLFFDSQEEAIASISALLSTLEELHGDDSELDPAAEACREAARPPVQSV